LVERRESKAMGRKTRRTQKEKIDYSLVSQKKAAWCIDNGYKVYPVGVDKVKHNPWNDIYTTFRIIIQRGVNMKPSKEIYTKIGASNKIWEIYGWLYDKHADR